MNIKEKILSRGFTLSGLAKAFGITQPTLSKTIKNNPSYNTLKKIADTIGMSVSELVSDEEPVRCPYCGKPLNVTIMKKNVTMTDALNLDVDGIIERVKKERAESNVSDPESKN